MMRIWVRVEMPEVPVCGGGRGVGGGRLREVEVVSVCFLVETGDVLVVVGLEG